MNVTLRKTNRKNEEPPVKNKKFKQSTIDAALAGRSVFNVPDEGLFAAYCRAELLDMFSHYYHEDDLEFVGHPTASWWYCTCARSEEGGRITLLRCLELAGPGAVQFLYEVY